ncbi:hypothetical protein FHS51_001372 [Sphingobium wenxiniae]|jgi:hypothetical protein|uniref:Uncharacterized protein n=2 Tax=Sphingobium TaxID=165695 RepID=T0HH68_9SPHN|nr:MULTISPECIES: hypothetical protein [Sphingobium]EQA96888.1 hypothetical protein L485_22675 [Sphingobium baderi LL03]KMS64085.1 hypothetical protein V475_20125 [Sphingobium baderi LL03]MBB6191150.1 hypothetical protein [Sphingobium wenxiniae]TWH96050.1 hypothetical protein IQ35_01139 [Sphingobium wenxiniae]WRD77923.1 hypothetical protein QQ987_07440 [Sphingobium baderi]
MEDLNHLLKREQEEMLRAQASRCSATRHAHQGLAQGYARRIRDHHHPYRTERTDGTMAFNPYPFGAEGGRA